MNIQQMLNSIFKRTKRDVNNEKRQRVAADDELRSSINEKQNILTPGSNIQINGNVISATDTTYTAGNGININGKEISNSRELWEHNITFRIDESAINYRATLTLRVYRSNNTPITKTMLIEYLKANNMNSINKLYSANGYAHYYSSSTGQSEISFYVGLYVENNQLQARNIFNKNQTVSTYTEGESHNFSTSSYLTTNDVIIRIF